MLQQTRIDTVIPYYNRFINRYPRIQDLANAPLDDVLKLWEGLGYYSRARNLHKTARIVASDLNGKFHSTINELTKLPGIGRYTAGAIASIAYDTRAPVLDGNVIRVFARLQDLPDDVTQTSTKNALWKLADDWLPEENVGDYNQALMELGQTICTPSDPQCGICPIQIHCQAFAHGTQTQRPVKRKKPATPHYDVVAGIVQNQDGLYLIAQRPNDGLLGGLWEFAGGKIEDGETPQACLQRELREELAIEVQVNDFFVQVKHAFTHFKITLHAYECEYLGAMPPYTEPQLLEVQNFAWVSLDEMKNYSFGKADRMIIEALQERRNMLL